MNFYDNLNGILKSKKVKKIELETELGITRSTIQAWKTAYPSAKYVKMLAEYLNVSADTLLGVSRPRSPEDDPEPEDTPNVLEAVTLFRQLPEREQIKFIGRLEDAVNQ